LKEMEIPRKTIIVFDTETTGKPRNWKNPPLAEKLNWPDLVSISWLVFSETGRLLKRASYIIKPAGWSSDPEAVAVHGISDERAEAEGSDLTNVLALLCRDLDSCRLLVAHNMDFDANVLRNALYWRVGLNPGDILTMPLFCTMKKATNELKIANKNGYGGYKWPSLDETYTATFGSPPPSGAHESMRDAEVCAAIYWKRWSA
jgi:DNA polymerase III epsilon subunit-like protein